MRRILLIAASLALAVGCGGKKKDAATGSGSGSAVPVETGNGGSGGAATTTTTNTPPPSNPPPATGSAGSGCAPPATIAADYTITKGCAVKPDGDLEIAETATLTIEPGAKVAFAKERRIEVKGKLVIAGTADAPVVLTSADASPNPGDWEGVIFFDTTKAGTSIDHAHVEYAGQNGSYGGYAIHFYGDVPPNRVSITNSEIVKSSGGGILIEKDKALPAKLENNTFADDDKTCITAPAEVWGAIGVNKCGALLAHVNETNVTKSTTWPKLDTAYVVDNNLDVGGTGDAPILTLPEGGTLKLKDQRYIRVGDGDGGGLVAKNVTFTSAAVTPDSGDWEGLVFEDKATGTTLDGCTIEYAGGDGSYGKSPIVIAADVDKIAKRVTITHMTFKSTNANNGIDSKDNKCGPYGDAAAGNKMEGSGSGSLCH